MRYVVYKVLGMSQIELVKRDLSLDDAVKMVKHSKAYKLEPLWVWNQRFKAQ
jgi:hypothetical protein